MVKEVKNLTNIRLTESDTDGIWLHFEAGDLKAIILLDTLSAIQSSGIVAATIQNWAREQLDKPEPLSSPPVNEFLKEGDEERTDVPGTRPSPLVKGGY